MLCSVQVSCQQPQTTWREEPAAIKYHIRTATGKESLHLPWSQALLRSEAERTPSLIGTDSLGFLVLLLWITATPNTFLLVGKRRCLRKEWASIQTSVWLGLLEDPYTPLGTHSQALSKHFPEAAKRHLEIQYIGMRNILTSATFVCNLGIMYDASSELCDLSKHLKERHNIARSLFWGVKADSGFCINGWQSWLFCWRGCQCFSEHVLKKNKTLHQGKCLKSSYGEFSWSLKNNTHCEMLFTRALKISTALYSVSWENHAMWLHTSW